MADEKIAINLPRPLPASDDCLPHAAMTLGSIRGVGTRPMPALVSRIVVQSHDGRWCVYRLDDGGGFVGDTWHPDRADAERTIESEFGVATADLVRQARPS